jgi:hypothetical protein
VPGAFFSLGLPAPTHQCLSMKVGQAEVRISVLKERAPMVPAGAFPGSHSHFGGTVRSSEGAPSRRSWCPTGSGGSLGKRTPPGPLESQRGARERAELLISVAKRGARRCLPRVPLLMSHFWGTVGGSEGLHRGDHWCLAVLELERVRDANPRRPLDSHFASKPCADRLAHGGSTGGRPGRSLSESCACAETVDVPNTWGDRRRRAAKRRKGWTMGLVERDLNLPAGARLGMVVEPRTGPRQWRR